MSQQVLLRMPPALKAALRARAEAQGVTLNALCVALLAGGIGWTDAEK